MKTQRLHSFNCKRSPQWVDACVKFYSGSQAIPGIDNRNNRNNLPNSQKAE
jgi:hypothetical protein